jgi:hypothetical protein
MRGSGLTGPRGVRPEVAEPTTGPRRSPGGILGLPGLPSRFAPRNDGYYSAGASSATSRRCGATLSVRLR